MAGDSQTPRPAVPSRALPLADLPEPEAGGVGALGPGDVAEMIAAQRRLVEKLSPCSGPDCAELTAHLRTLRLLEEELRRRMPPAPARAHTPIQAARLVSDVFQFEVPPSHRKQLGRAITAAKSGFTQGLKPFHIEMLRPQHAFNREMLGVLEHLYGMSATSSRTDLSEWVRKRLTPVLEPTQWEVHKGHRGQGLGRAVRLVKRSYLTALGPLLRELLAGQRQWNQAAVELLAEAVKPQPLSPEEASRRVAELLKLADPIGRASSLGARASSPLWREVFRRQVTYNQEITLCLADLLGTRAPVEPPSAEDYAAWCDEREPELFRRSAEAVKGLTQQPWSASS